MSRVGWMVLLAGVMAASGPPRPAIAQVQAPAPQADDDARQELRELQREIQELRKSGMKIPREHMTRMRELMRQSQPRRERRDRREKPEREVDPQLRAEYEDIQREVRDLRTNGMEIPSELADRERELRAEMSGRSDRGRGGRDGGGQGRGNRDRRQADRWLNQAYEEVSREIKNLKGSGQRAAPELLALQRELKREMQFRQGGPSGKDRAASLKRELDRMTREITDLNTRGEPVPEMLRKRIGVVQRELKKAQRDSSRPTGDRGRRELDGLIRKIELLEDRGEPVPESLLRRAEALERSLKRTSRGKTPSPRRESPEDLERQLAQLEETMDRLEASGRPIPETLIRKAEAIVDRLERGDFGNQPQGEPEPEGPRGRNETRPQAPPGGTVSAEEELSRLDGLLTKFEDARWEPPEELLKRCDELARRIESGEVEPSSRGERPQPQRSDLAPPDNPDRRRDEALLRELRERVARVEGQGMTVDPAIHRRIAELEHQLASDAARPAPPGEARPPTDLPRDAAARKRDEAKLEKLVAQMDRLDSLGQSVPENLLAQADRLERQLAAGPPVAHAPVDDPPRRGRREEKGDPRLRAEYEGLIRQVQEFKEAGQPVPEESETRLAQLREQMNPSPRKGSSKRSEQLREVVLQLESKLETVEESIEQIRQSGTAVPPQLTAQASQYRKALAKAQRFGGGQTRKGKKTSYLNQKVVPFEAWARYIEEVIEVYGFDGMQKRACMDTLRDCQDRARPMIEAEIGRPGPGRAGKRLSPQTQRLVDTIFEELKGRAEYLITPAQKAEAEAKRKSTVRKPSRHRGLRPSAQPGRRRGVAP